MKIKFWKMHGARNDFVLFDDRRGRFPVGDRAFIAHLAARNTGIGAEGVILIQASNAAAFRMRFFNPDGAEAGMCGNGARCAARLAYELGAAGKSMTIETAAGTLRAQVLRGGVRIGMTEPSDWRTGRSLSLAGRELAYDFVNTGVPHVVIRTDDLSGADVRNTGAAVRYHAAFAPAGTNVNFLQVSPDGGLRVRTYERGVEDETPACGTGATACALIAAKNGWARLPVRVQTAGGDMLTIGGRLTDSGAVRVTLTGPAEHVFEGAVEYRISNKEG